ncbi:uncharacterized protein EV420DRAFT_377520 [Desarmillaria tabescens]|uniref:EF-hand domain-containing protein n=1 Tax=Armillaria tabescens TaxID=1929756 RepID=A0AA39J270_ARMTA|nr:uncharacterized protein EV420DRAFT_377520 [Desarmillaria tabescens]KAK0434767.1 hypothetical protein EV420DRAFT_377520 [Desarmillaria tabescens]
MVHSWFAQASQLYRSSDWSSFGRTYLQRDLVFNILVEIMDFEKWKDCQLSDTFMADQSTVYISIWAPCTDQQTGKIQPPVISFCMDSDPTGLLSRAEVEDMLDLEITLEAWWWECMLPQKQLSTIQEINALCGFDPALGGTDIREYFDLLSLQLSSCEETDDPVKDDLKSDGGQVQALHAKSRNNCMFLLPQIAIALAVAVLSSMLYHF